MSREFVMFAGLELGQQLFDGPSDLGVLCDERLPVYLSCNITISWKYQQPGSASAMKIQIKNLLDKLKAARNYEESAWLRLRRLTC
jgi:hypothetical protein